jgi:phosphatidylserine/phosphatidylglycerophosphate/cardiolipin synthase-like enzyme
MIRMGVDGPQPVPRDGSGMLAMPVDPPSPSGGDRFFGFGPPPAEFNKVSAFISVIGEAYVEMGKALKLPSGPGDFIYLLGWDFGRNANLGGSTAEALLRAADARGVTIRAMLFFNQQPGAGTLGSSAGPPPRNQPNVDFFNSLKNGSAIHDNRYLNFGSHHQKMLVIKHGEDLIGFCGGMDIEPGRANWHDCHLKIEGPAAFDLHQNFVDRWTDHPLGQNPSSFVPRVFLPPPPAKQNPKGDLQVRIVRTYGNGSAHDGLNDIAFSESADSLGLPGPPSSSKYAFAPIGERSIFNQIKSAILAANRFIYMEDQYLVADQPMAGLGDPLPKVLAAKLAEPDFKKLVILIARTEQVNGELLQAWQRRRNFISQLKAAAPDKVTVCQYKITQGADASGLEVPKFVHSKTWIFDDEFCLVSSANCNRRGYSHDSEIGAAVYDENLKGDRLYFAHELRMRLWMKHLNPSGDAKNLTNQDILDPVVASRFWSAPPAFAAIEPYDENGDKRNPPEAKNPILDRRVPSKVSGLAQTIANKILQNANDDWDVILDPDGS